MIDQAKVEAAQQERAKRIRMGMESDPRDSRHGTEFAKYGCSCPKCQAYRTKKEREGRKRRQERRLAGRSELDGRASLAPMWKDAQEIDESRVGVRTPSIFAPDGGSRAASRTKYCG